MYPIRSLYMPKFPSSLFSSSIIRGSLTIALILTILVPVAPASKQNSKDAPIISLGRPIEVELAGGQSNWYQVFLKAGEYVHIIVDQRGIDVIVRLYSPEPDRKLLMEVDSPNGTQGPEPVYTIADISGPYFLEVLSQDKTAATGRYEVRIENLRIASKEDKVRVNA